MRWRSIRLHRYSKRSCSGWILSCSGRLNDLRMNRLGFTFFHSSDDGCEVIIGQNHITGLLGHLCSRDTHGDTDTCLLQGRSIIHTVTSHASNLVQLSCQDSHQFTLIFWVGTWEHKSAWVADHLRESLLLLILGHRLEFKTSEGMVTELVGVAQDTDLESNGLSSFLDITSDHYHTDTSLTSSKILVYITALLDWGTHFRSRGVLQGNDTNDQWVLLQFLIVVSVHQQFVSRVLRPVVVW